MRALAVSLLLAACGASSSGTVVELPPENLPSPPPPVEGTLAPPRPAPRARSCAAPADLAGCDAIGTVRVGPIALSSSTCVVDLRVRTGDVGRIMRCPSGAAVVFDRVTYGGTYDGARLDACVTTRFPFDDGCMWQSTQRLHGRRDDLRIEYAEHPISGHGCETSACTATATLEMLTP